MLLKVNEIVIKIIIKVTKTVNIQKFKENHIFINKKEKYHILPRPRLGRAFHPILAIPIWNG